MRSGAKNFLVSVSTYRFKNSERFRVPTIQKFQCGWKIKRLTPFHLESFRKWGLWFDVLQFFTLFSLFSWFWCTLYNVGGSFSLHVKFYSFMLMHKVSTQDFLKIYLKWLSQLLINVRLLIILLLDELGAPCYMKNDHFEDGTLVTVNISCFCCHEGTWLS